MMFERFTEKAIKVIMLAQEEARRLGHNFVGTEQILLGLVGEGTGIAAKTLKGMGINLKEARAEVEKIIGRGSGFVAVEIPFTPRAKRVLELSWDEARQLGHNYIGTEHLLLGLIREGEGVAAKVLESLGVDLTKLRGNLIRMLGETRGSASSGSGGGSGSSSSSGGSSGGKTKTPTLDEFSQNLTLAAEELRLDPVIGREVEIERMVQILGRRTKNNPVLIGEPGVGKTALAEGLAQRIVNSDVPEMLRDKKIIQLDMGLLVAGTKYRGEFEERLKKVMDEIRQANNIILVIDEMHTLIGAGAAEGAIDAANILKPSLSRGELQVIGATTITEYRKHIEKDAALERRFQPVFVDQPTLSEAVEIIRGLREKYEEHHKLTISDEAIDASVTLSDRYISDRFLPDKAIDLIDEAASRVRLNNSALPEDGKKLEREIKALVRQKEEAIRAQEFDKATELRDKEAEMREGLREIADAHKKTLDPKNITVTVEDIASVVSQWTGIPVSKLTESESDKLMKMEDTLHEQVIGQHEAVVAISKAIRRARVGLKSPDRPIGSFIFCGPTGVGKTELAKTLAQYFFGSVENMIRLDMSEFMERHTVSKLIGSPPGYVGYNEGGQLTEAIRRKPYSVLLFDEVEKAHPDVFNILLQILDDGRLSDSKGRVVDFKNTIVILTSNVGASGIENPSSIGFGGSAKEEAAARYAKIKDRVKDAMKQVFRPEFINRLDDTIIFEPLKKEEIRLIVDIMMKDLLKRLNDRMLKLELTAEVKDFLAEEGYDPTYGARPLRRVLQRRLEDPLSEALLMSEYKEGNIIEASLKTTEEVKDGEDGEEIVTKKKEVVFKVTGDLPLDSFEIRVQSKAKGQMPK
ncbi:MAG: ATP-dependent Clp protease ATP-binding subunit, partial [Vampirovibrionales bacterium]|nr:ATP-dependent Clp protease ATP-binding subunit [Vampirovibrionales bacterium]